MFMVENIFHRRTNIFSGEHQFHTLFVQFDFHVALEQSNRFQSFGIYLENFCNAAPLVEKLLRKIGFDESEKNSVRNFN